MLKIIPAFFWILLLIFLFSNLPGFLEYETPSKGHDRSGPQISQFTKEQDRLLDLHNEKRSEKGMDPLVLDKKLCDYAQRHAERMAGNGRLAHSSMVELQDFCGADVVGENIAWGQDDEEDVVSSWMWSPMHRWNILGYSYKKVGFGVKKDADGRKYWCVVFSS